MKSRIFSILIVGILFPLAFAAEPAHKDSGTEEKDVVSLTEEWRDTLRYGIDTEVEELLKKLSKEKETKLAEDVLEVFSYSENPMIQEVALTYFTQIKYSGATDVVIRQIEDYEVQGAPVLMNALRYLKEISTDRLADAALPLVNHENDGVAVSAIQAVGASGNETHAEKLLELLEDEDYKEERKSSIILALGELSYQKAGELLVEILEDEDSEPMWRRYSCVALGKIGDPETFTVVRDAYRQDDTMLRSYAVSGIALYDVAEVKDILISALRDSYWKVRVSAAQGLAERKAEDAVPILIYKARKDPEEKVRSEAMQALSKIGSDEAVDYLTSLIPDKKAGLTQRDTALKLITENHLDRGFESIEQLIRDEWEKKDSKWLNLAGQYLSREKSAQLKEIFEKFLDHPDFTIKIYGIRGTERNGFSDMRQKMEELAQEGNHPAVRKAALAALEAL